MMLITFLKTILSQSGEAFVCLLPFLILRSFLQKNLHSTENNENQQVRPHFRPWSVDKINISASKQNKPGLGAPKGLTANDRVKPIMMDVKNSLLNQK